VVGVLVGVAWLSSSAAKVSSPAAVEDWPAVAWTMAAGAGVALTCWPAAVQAASERSSSKGLNASSDTNRFIPAPTEP